MKVSVDSEAVELIREIAKNPDYNSEELFPGKANGHKFKVGQRCQLVGLVNFPEFNGETVEISAIGQDG